MEIYFGGIDFNTTVRDINFTKNAVNKIHTVVTSEDFEDMDADMIFKFLLSEMELVSFKDYLKRYIYERAELQEPFSLIPDQLYRDIIVDSFEQNRAPHSFTCTSVKWKTAVNRWLEQENVQRSTVFLLGFGLRMREKDVSEFLMKVIKESDFDFYDPWEVICWYCFKNDLPYAKAVELTEKYDHMLQGNDSDARYDRSGGITEQELKENGSENRLCSYLYHLKKEGIKEKKESLKYLNFKKLYRKCQTVIAELYQNDEDAQCGGKDWIPEEIGPADIEKVLCDGIPMTRNGNLKKMSKSLLNRQFQQKRITRQRLDSLMKRNLEIERYDFISLQFLISSQKEDENPQYRCRMFIQEVNEILEQCGMMKIYPANPYEAFILMCLLTEMPLLTYYDVWSMSYEG